MNYPRILTSGDSAVTVEMGGEISPEVNAKVRKLYDALSSDSFRGFVEAIPTFRSVTVIYDPMIVSFSKVRRLIVKYIKRGGIKQRETAAICHIPVCYGGEYGEDLADVAALAQLTEDEVVAVHSSVDYLIYMLGFLPGFPYLGGLDPALITPRLDSPRQTIPAGSVGIGGEQTGIYPIASPGGWRLIGRTPLSLYNPANENPILYSAGDFIRFYPITPERFIEIEKNIASDSFEVERTVREINPNSGDVRYVN